ncbi:Glucose-6-phosphate 1-dehydrogenase [Limihaloglobus sulfuriphilus]|uniref:Glucose-6-phosphate 1-dehydrogenase n=1 Tax=Limihaloglobus sulfuriphilus TaxID=1851148 RepID=A0A1Q2MCA5_9BACT|nr:glucose-6-phosphate dehydrogenase [Limihaloglobus sulfuriphilus]AQQ70290.1 Glucose-6-phosphate 1-dehydrogenase [Limihaloglobus sulfuriphilus]
MNTKGFIFIIFGATGDLSKRKLIPAIYNLLKHGKLEKFHVFGISRRPYSGEKMVDTALEFIEKLDPEPDPGLIKRLKENTTYFSANFTHEQEFAQLKNAIDKLDKTAVYDRIFYLATGSNHFDVISGNLIKTEIAQQKNCKTKVVFEKPFGRDEKSSKKLNDVISETFTEEQTYRIDHYLGKEIVGTISVLRFTNRIFEPIWNNAHIESIQIKLDENIGISERGAYYDTYGAVRDMVQNHMIQLLALLTMEIPDSITGKGLRDRKAQVIKDMVVRDALLGQYRGYKQEKDIPQDSKTDTFAALNLEILNSRWAGVPVFLRTGKFLSKKESKITVKFKKVKCLFDDDYSTEGNILEIRIFPDEGISLYVNTKTPGEKRATQVKLDFCYTCLFGENTPEGYENLLNDVINGDQTTFTRFDELQNAWKVVDPIERIKIYPYEKGSDGPEEMALFNERNNLKWS